MIGILVDLVHVKREAENPLHYSVGKVGGRLVLYDVFTFGRNLSHVMTNSGGVVDFT